MMVALVEKSEMEKLRGRRDLELLKPVLEWPLLEDGDSAVEEFYEQFDDYRSPRCL